MTPDAARPSLTRSGWDLPYRSKVGKVTVELS